MRGWDNLHSGFQVRRVVFWTHLTTGITLAAVILIMAATGALLTYQRQIQQWADTRGLGADPPSSSARRLTPADLVAAVERGDPEAGRPTSIRWHRDPTAPVEVAFGREHTLFVNAYTGAVLGSGSDRTRAFFRTVTDLHRWLAFRGDGVQRGRAITGAANLAFLVIVLCGFYLWWPRNLTARAFRNALLFRRGLRSKARDFNWHNVIGIWALAPLVIVITSGAVISYAWAGALVERMATDSDPAPATTPVVVPSPEAAAPNTTTTQPNTTTTQPNTTSTQPNDGPGDLLARAEPWMPDWRTIKMEWPVRSDRAVFTLDAGTGGQPQRQAELTLDATSGAALDWSPFRRAPRAERVRSILRYAHTGEVLGVAGQTVAGAASAGAIVLIWTGIALALRRLRAWRARRQRLPSHSVAAAEGDVR